MICTFATPAIRKDLSDHKRCLRKYGPAIAAAVGRHLRRIREAPDWPAFQREGLGDLHPLVGGTLHCWSLNVPGRRRLLFDLLPKGEGVRILGVLDTHGGTATTNKRIEAIQR